VSKDFYNAEGFYEFVGEGKLMAAKCGSCGALYLPPRPICSACHGEHMEWVEMGGNGKIEGFTVITVGPTRMVQAGYDRKNPYCVGIVRLDEGPAISAQIFGVDVQHPDQIKVGTVVKAKFFERQEGDEVKKYVGFEAT
jgi:uncharacterized OB-fold protein